jgi:hypothetical protein
MKSDFLLAEIHAQIVPHYEFLPKDQFFFFELSIVYHVESEFTAQASVHLKE